jgi:toxin ParE1/3/4
MRYQVELTLDANRDLIALAEYIADHHTIEQARYVVSEIERVVQKLTTFPDRGAFPPELLALGIRDFRQVFFMPYRMVYRVDGKHVYVVLIADGRRDMQSLLAERLVR